MNLLVVKELKVEQRGLLLPPCIERSKKNTSINCRCKATSEVVNTLPQMVFRVFTLMIYPKRNLFYSNGKCLRLWETEGITIFAS